MFGADSHAILTNLGYTDGEIGSMAERSVTGDELR